MQSLPRTTGNPVYLDYSSSRWEPQADENYINSGGFTVWRQSRTFGEFYIVSIFYLHLFRTRDCAEGTIRGLFLNVTM